MILSLGYQCKFLRAFGLMYCMMVKLNGIFSVCPSWLVKRNILLHYVGVDWVLKMCKPPACQSVLKKICLIYMQENRNKNHVLSVNPLKFLSMLFFHTGEILVMKMYLNSLSYPLGFKCGSSLRWDHLGVWSPTWISVSWEGLLRIFANSVYAFQHVELLTSSSFSKNSQCLSTYVC